MAAITIALEVSVAAVWSAASAPSVEIVNRKGDRLPLVPAFSAVNQPWKLSSRAHAGPSINCLMAVNRWQTLSLILRWRTWQGAIAEFW
jgi:hypothetical protein